MHIEKLWLWYRCVANMPHKPIYCLLRPLTGNHIMALMVCVSRSLYDLPTFTWQTLHPDQAAAAEHFFSFFSIPNGGYLACREMLIVTTGIDILMLWESILFQSLLGLYITELKVELHRYTAHTYLGVQKLLSKLTGIVIICRVTSKIVLWFDWLWLILTWSLDTVTWNTTAEFLFLI